MAIHGYILWLILNQEQKQFYLFYAEQSHLSITLLPASVMVSLRVWTVGRVSESRKLNVNCGEEISEEGNILGQKWRPVDI